MASHTRVVIPRAVLACTLLSIWAAGAAAQALVPSGEALKEIRTHLDLIDARRQEMDGRYGTWGLNSTFRTLLQEAMEKSGVSYEGLTSHDKEWAGWLINDYFDTLKEVYTYHALALEFSLNNVGNSRWAQRSKLQAVSTGMNAWADYEKSFRGSVAKALDLLHQRIVADIKEQTERNKPCSDSDCERKQARVKELGEAYDKTSNAYFKAQEEMRNHTRHFLEAIPQIFDHVAQGGIATRDGP
jgi:hypothetical protein